MVQVVAYAPTSDASEAVRVDFWQHLESVMCLLQLNDLIVCLGNFNMVSFYV